VAEWIWSKVARWAVADALLAEINAAYAEYVGPFVRADGTPVPIADRITAVASARVVPWLYISGDYVVVTKVPERFAAVMTLKAFANMVGGIYWESEGAVLVKLGTLVSFIESRRTEIETLLAQSGQ
jgi:hypothetical protein